MRWLALLAMMAWLAGCQNSQAIDRPTLDDLYLDTAMAPGVLSALPQQIDSQAPPIVVNWWYAGSRGEHHVLILRELTWDADGRPIGKESRFRTPAESLPIIDGFDYSDDESRWLALYEASPAISPPADLPTRRYRPGNTAPQPIDPQPIDPADADALKR